MGRVAVDRPLDGTATLAAMGDIVEFASNGSTAQGYLALPPTGSGPGLIVIQEWWGLVPHIEDVCDRYAAAGFVALAPDLYHGESTKSPPSTDLEVELTRYHRGPGFWQVSAVSMGIHTGAHIDSPLHCYEDGITTAQIPLERLVGDVSIIDCTSAGERPSGASPSPLNESGVRLMIPIR